MLYTLHTLLLLQRACSCEIVLLAANRRETLSYASSNHELRSCHPHVSHLSKQQCGHPAGLLRTLPMCHLLGSFPPTQQRRLRGATPTLFKNGCRGPRPVVTRMYVQPLHQGEKNMRIIRKPMRISHQSCMKRRIRKDVRNTEKRTRNSGFPPPKKTNAFFPALVLSFHASRATLHPSGNHFRLCHKVPQFLHSLWHLEPDLSETYIA